MLRNVLFCVGVYLIVAVSDEMLSEKADPATVHRKRMFKFALYQDLLVVLSVLKMMIFEGYTLSGVVQRVRSAGIITQMYIATSVALHGALLLDEPTDHKRRLSPAPYLPPDLLKEQRDLLLV